MTDNVFVANLKKYRLAKNMTQERAAERLGVNAQTVSRWECGTTLPDALMLPEIARLYGVTVDDLFKQTAFGYENYAQRLSSVYENSRDPVDFMRCREEYLKLIKQDKMSIADKWQYGWIHMYMMNYCRDVALEWYPHKIFVFSGDATTLLCVYPLKTKSNEEGIVVDRSRHCVWIADDYGSPSYLYKYEFSGMDDFDIQ